jgi:Flp pilus assembly protein TadD
MEARTADADAPDVKAAVEDLSRLNPTPRALAPSPDEILERGEVLFIEGKRSEAAMVFLQALEKYPRSERAWNNLGVALSGMGQRTEALGALAKAFELKPDYRDARMNYIEVLLVVGRRAEAQNELREVLRRHPADAEAAQVLASLQR